MSSNLPRKGRVLLWDTHKTFRADQHDTISGFKRAVALAITGHKGFFISYTGRGTPVAFEDFCSTAWDIMDGNKETHISIDELSEVTRHGKALAHFGELLRGARKFNGVLHISANALPEVPTTVRRETLIKWAGMQQTMNDKKMLADFMSVNPLVFNDLKPLEFLVLEQGQVRKQIIKYKNPPL